MTHTYTVTNPGFLKREVTDRDGNAQGDFFLKNDIKKKAISPEGGWYTHVHPRTYHIKPKTDFKLTLLFVSHFYHTRLLSMKSTCRYLCVVVLHFFRHKTLRLRRINGCAEALVTKSKSRLI